MIQIDLSDIVRLRNNLATLVDPDTVLRSVAFGVQFQQVRRIHQDGLRADGSSMGTYSDGYLKRRQEAPYNRTGDSKVILVLTSQMQDNYQVIEQGEREYALGWLNPVDGEKYQWLTERYGDVWGLSDAEATSIETIINEQVLKALNS